MAPLLQPMPLLLAISPNLRSSRRPSLSLLCPVLLPMPVPSPSTPQHLHECNSSALCSLFFTIVVAQYSFAKGTFLCHATASWWGEAVIIFIIRISLFCFGSLALSLTHTHSHTAQYSTHLKCGSHLIFPPLPVPSVTKSLYMTSLWRTEILSTDLTQYSPWTSEL